MTLRTHEKGATLIEVLGVLAVVATIAVGMFTGIARMNQKIKLTRAQTEVSDIVKAMRTQFSSFTPSWLWSLNPTWKIPILHLVTKTFPPAPARICCWATGGTIRLQD